MNQRTIPIKLGPWRGVRDSGDAGQQDPQFAQDAINCWFQDPQNGGAVWARPGMERVASSDIESGSLTPAQAVFSCFIGGTARNFLFVNGKVYRQTAATTWTDVTPVGVTINATNRVGVIAYNDELIVNDGANEPWRGTNLSSTPITGTEIEINTAGNAWVARGKPTVHGGKLFFVVATIDATNYDSRIVWSEEGDAATGYLQDGFTNSWDLLQSHVPAERIYAIQGTNNGLYYFRNYSIGVIYGAVNADFATASTHDGVSNDVGVWKNTGGTPLRWAEVLLAKDYLWFMDNAGRPVRLKVGGKTIEPLWQQIRRKLQGIRSAGSSSIMPLSWPQMAYVPDLDKVVMHILADEAASAGATTGAHLYVFDASLGSYEGRWTIAQTTQAATPTPIAAIAAGMRQANLDAPEAFTLLVSTGNAGSTRVWHQGALVMYGSDATSLGDNAGAMHMSLTTMLTPDEQDVEFLVSGVSMEGGPDSATLSLDQYTPRGAATALSITGITNSDSIQASHDHGIYRAGLRQFGRWWRGVFHWNVPSGSVPYFFERALITVKPRRTIGVTK